MTKPSDPQSASSIHHKYRIYHTDWVCKDYIINCIQFKVPNMNFLLVHWQIILSIMHHMLSVMFLLEQELSWLLLKWYVHHPGLESTMATSQLMLNFIHINDHHTLVLMLTQNQLQGLVLTLILYWFTTPLQIAMVSRVLHLKMVAYSPVLCAQSKGTVMLLWSELHVQLLLIKLR